MPMPRLATLLLTGSLAMPLPSFAAVCEAKSGGATVALLELYTSEGCSSCPPADRWIAELPTRGFGPERVVPLAFHVDYWNYIGWTDRFSQAAFTQRQREFARRNGMRTVYTPGFVLSGREYRRWSFGGFDDDVARVNRQAARADIALTLERHGKTLKIGGNATAKQTSGNAELYLALFENNLASDVRAGENSGRRLEHAYVVRRLIGPLAFDTNGQRRFGESLKLEPDWKLPDLGVVAFVQAAKGTEILQALALGVCP